MRASSKKKSAPETPAAAAPDFLPEMRSAVIAVGASGKILSLNRPAELLLRGSAGRLLHQPGSALPAPLAALLKESLAGGQSVSSRTLTLFPGTLDEILIDAGATVCRDEKQKTLAVLLVFQNLTFAKKMEAGLRHLDRLAGVGTLAAGCAHEVKNAMVAIKTVSQLMLEKNHDAEITSLVLREIQRIETIISRILRTASPAPIALVPVGLHTVLDHSLQLVQRRPGAQHIHWIRSLDAPLDRIAADEQQLGQAFINLLLNAVEAMQGKGTLRVATKIIPAAKNSAAPPQIQLTIQDTGGGIPAENLPRLFDPFFTTKPEGTGLGLPITRRIILEHAGTVTVESELQKGTAFHVLLPLLPAAA